MKKKKRKDNKKRRIAQIWQKNISEPMEQWYHKNIDIQNRTIYFGCWQPSEEITEMRDDGWMVNDWSIQNIIKGLYILNRLNHDPITIIWFSYGGDWDAGMALYDIIQQIKSPIVIKCYGRVRSMGTIVLQSATKRLIAPHCEFMIHYGTAGIEEVHAKDFERFAEDIKLCNRIMEQIYLKRIKEKHPKFTLQKLRDEYLKYDKYLSAKEAINLGLADGIIEKFI